MKIKFSPVDSSRSVLDLVNLFECRLRLDVIHVVERRHFACLASTGRRVDRQVVGRILLVVAVECRRPPDCSSLFRLVTAPLVEIFQQKTAHIALVSEMRNLNDARVGAHTSEQSAAAGRRSSTHRPSPSGSSESLPGRNSSLWVAARRGCAEIAHMSSFQNE